MKLKQIEITFNDDTKQSDINGTADLLTVVFETFGVIATILVHEVEEGEDIVHIDEHGNPEIVGKRRRI